MLAKYVDKSGQANCYKIYEKQHDRDKQSVKPSKKRDHNMGYKNTGRGDICALMTRSATITKNNTMGIIHIFFDFVARTKSWRIEENIYRIVPNNR